MLDVPSLGLAADALDDATGNTKAGRMMAVDSELLSALASPEAEQSAIGAALQDSACIAHAPDLAPEHFADRAHGLIWRAVRDLDAAGSAVDVVTVVDLLRERGELEDAGGAGYVASLALCVPTPQHFAAYAGRVIARASSRALCADLAEALRQLRTNGDPETIAGPLAQRLADFAAPKRTAPLFALVPVADIAQTEPVAPGRWWGDYLPAGVVTGLSAHGGTGKSTVALMLSVCIALGLDLFGVRARRGIVAYYSAEDPADLVRHRLRLICRHLLVDPAELDERLHVLDATEGDATLFHEVAAGGRRFGATTPAYAALRAFVRDRAVDVLIVDNASDVFDASEIDRAKVRGFMRSLAQIAKERDGAVLLLTHVDKGTSRGDRNGSEGYSGSTAWHNSARSRLYLSRDRDGGLTLEHQKNNLGPMRAPMRLLWPTDGIPQLDTESGFVQHVADNSDTKALLRLIHEFSERGEFVAASQYSPANAARILAGERGYPKRKPAEVFGLLRDAERQGLIERQAYRTGDRKDRERWALTGNGCALIGAAAPTAPTAPTYEAGAVPKAGAGGAPTAPTCGAGGVGGLARAQMQAEAG